MELLKCLRNDSGHSNHWIELQQDHLSSDLQAIDIFRRKLEASLVELGRVDCRLQDSISSLRAELTDTHDQLRSSVGEVAQADINAAMVQLVEAIRRARELADAVVADADRPQ